MPPPNEAIVLTVHSQPSPSQMLARQSTAMGRFKMILVMLVCAAPVVASYLSYYVFRPSGVGKSHGELIQPTLALPEVQAATLDGKVVSLRSLKGQWLLMVVDSGACAEACEKRLYLQRQLREMTGRERERIDKVWLVIDEQPLRPALSSALQATPGLTILRASRAEIARWLKPAPGHSLEDHLYLVDPMGEWMMRLPADPDPLLVKRDLDRLLRASASWDLPGR